MSTASWITVLLIIAAMFLVILVGWVARRRGYLTAETTAALSKFIVDITIPSLVFTQMLATVTPTSLLQRWPLPLYGAAIMVIGEVVGLLVMPLFSRRAQRPTFIFLISIANWIYLPLPIVQALYGNDGVQALLLFNVGAQLVLWSLGVWTLRGGKPDLASLRNLLLNAGLIATGVGIIIALLFPFTRTFANITTAPQGLPHVHIAYVVYSALKLIGSLTIPLSLIVTGAQLGELDLSDHRPSRTLTGVLVARLFLAPAATIALVWLFAQAGLTIPLVPRMIGYIIALMPVAVSCSLFTERFGGDTSLAARATFYSTLFSILTVPALFYLIQRLRF